MKKEYEDNIMVWYYDMTILYYYMILRYYNMILLCDITIL